MLDGPCHLFPRGLFTPMFVRLAPLLRVLRQDAGAAPPVQAAAADLEPGKVKGLFGSIPVGSIERVAALGLQEPNEATSAALFRRTWYTFSDGGCGFAEKRVVGSAGVPFPHTFSRYSTLEQDRALMTQPPAASL